MQATPNIDYLNRVIKDYSRRNGKFPSFIKVSPEQYGFILLEITLTGRSEIQPSVSGVKIYLDESIEEGSIVISD